MKTRIRLMSKTSREYSEQNTDKNFYGKIFPLFISVSITLLLLLVSYLAYSKSEILSLGIFLALGFSGVLFIHSLLRNTSNKLSFYSDYKDHDIVVIKNNYNYYKTPHLESSTKQKIWKNIYYKKYFLYNTVTILSVTFSIITLAFLFDLFGIKETQLLMFTIIFCPIFIGIFGRYIFITMLKKKIYNSKNRFYFISRFTKKFGFVTYENELGGEDYFFQK